jgi:TP901 family phage tail tape measure protein
MTNEEEIRQQMVLDAHQVLETLGLLENGFTAFSDRLTKTASALGILNSAAADTSLLRIKESASGAANQMPRLASGINEVARSANLARQQTNHWVLSWETLARVAQTQLILRSYNTVRDAITESYEAALKFQKAVSEIHAVDSSRSYGEIATTIRQLSDAFNQPISDVAEGQYQAISNQFVKVADQSKLLTASNALAKVSCQELGTAVSLVAGTLNAYGESADKAALRAAQFDQAIALGHFRMADLATAMGRVQTLGHELGVSVEELQAALVTISIGGVKANEAGTQLRSVMMGMLKPSADLKEAYQQLGVESGPALIATYGLAGALQQLQKVGGSAASQLSAMFPNMRALVGELRIGGEGAQKYKEALDRALSVNPETLNSKLIDFSSTDAEQVTKELNKVKNYFTTEFGTDIVHTMKSLTAGADGFLSTIKTITHDLPYIGAALGAASTAWLLYSMRTKTAAADTVAAGAAVRTATRDIDVMLGATSASSASKGGFLSGIGGFSGLLSKGLMFAGLVEEARIGGALIGESLRKGMDARFEAEGVTYAKELSNIKQAADDQIREAERATEAIIRGYRQRAAEANKTLLQQRQDIQRSALVEEEVTKMSLDHVMQARRQMTQEMLSASEAAHKKADEELPRTISELRTKQRDEAMLSPLARPVVGHLHEQEARNPDREVNPVALFRRYTRETESAIKEAGQALATAKDPVEEKIAQEKMNRAQMWAQKTAELAKGQGSREQITAAKYLDDVENQRIVSLEKEKELQTQIAELTEGRAHKSEEHNATIKADITEIDKLQKKTVTDENGKERPMTSAEFKQHQTRLQTATQKLVSDVKGYGKDFSEPFMNDPEAFQAMFRRAEREAGGFQIRQVEFAPEALERLRAQLEGMGAKLGAKVAGTKDLERYTGESVGVVGVDRLAKDAQDKANKALAAGVARRQYETEMRKNSSAFTQQYAHFQEGINNYSHQNTPRQEQATRDLVAGALQANKLFHQGKYGKNKEDSLKTLLNQDNTRHVAGPWNNTQIATPMENMLELMKQRQALEKSAPPDSKKDAQDAQRVLQIINQQTQAISNKTSAINDQIESIQNLADAWENLIGVSAVYGDKPQTACTGNFIYRADGGRGSDTIPAMLSPGEMVINAASSRKFASQLIAMNAGTQPVFRNEGGQTTTVGDINVTVNGGASGKQTARSIAVELRRELRRGLAVL